MFKILDGREYFYQWDLNQKLIVEDDSINEVHFSNRTDGCSLVVEVDELRQASVPNILLQDYWDIRVYAYCSSGESKYTKVEEKFEVKKRPKPSYYIYTEEENKIWDNKVDIFQGKENSKKILSTNENGKVVTEINVDEILTNKDIPRPTASDEGTYLGCKNGAAAWMPVEASGGGGTQEKIIDVTFDEEFNAAEISVDINGNPFLLSEFTLWLKVAFVALGNYNFFRLSVNEGNNGSALKNLPGMNFNVGTAFAVYGCFAKVRSDGSVYAIYGGQSNMDSSDARFASIVGLSSIKNDTEAVNYGNGVYKINISGIYNTLAKGTRLIVYGVRK